MDNFTRLILYTFDIVIVYIFNIFLGIRLIESIILLAILLVIGVVDKLLEKLDWRMQLFAGIIGNASGIILIIIGFFMLILNFIGILPAPSTSVGLYFACITIGAVLLGAVNHQVKKPYTDKRVKKKLEWGIKWRKM
ncbi:MAG: hypothetical protein M1562_01080 [Candidatus Marsarchaeota archaeon]|jgi:hypothetical protein|nr:hypothetical protein [Candidatus Marsarchaeota archaeon]